MTTVTPTTDDQGNIVGFDISTQQSYDSRHHPEDMIPMDDGSYQHVFQGVTLDEDAGTGSFNYDEYLGTLQEVYPGLNDAVGWLADAQDEYPHLAEAWNNALDSEDLEAVNQLTEQILQLYLDEANTTIQDEPEGEEPVEEYDEEVQTTQEWFDNIPDETLEAAVDEIHDTQFSEDQVETMSALSNAYDPESPEYSILMAGQMIAMGHISAEDAIDQIVNEYGDAAAAQAYFYLQNELSNH
jgi:hypothetical protein